MTTGASRYPPRPELRASDAERERVATFLRDQSLEGRLTTDELDERLGRAYHAVTVRELQELVVDLPGSPWSRPPRGRPALPAVRRSPNLHPLAIAACVVLVAPWLLGVAASVVLALGIAFVAVLFALAFVLARSCSSRLPWSPRRAATCDVPAARRAPGRPAAAAAGT